VRACLPFRGARIGHGGTRRLAEVEGVLDILAHTRRELGCSEVELHELLEARGASVRLSKREPRRTLCFLELCACRAGVGAERCDL
jgi:hypothetical protein